MFKNVEKLLADGYKASEHDVDLLVQINDQYMCTGVYHIGKYPQIFHSCHYKNGTSWNIRYRGLTVQIPNPKSFLGFRLGSLFQEIKYAIKSYFSVKSGFVRMESKFNDGDGFYWDEFDPEWDDEYYACAVFGNGRHIPLPILANWEPTENRLQKLAIKLADGNEAVKIANKITEDSEHHNI